MSIQRILANNRNQIVSAALSASDVAGSSQVYQQSATRGGNGNVALSGDYSGTADATIDIDIIDATGSGRISLPVFRGIGSGNISNIVAGTLPQQDITITLADMGVPTTAASVEFYGVTLYAKDAGAGGNDIIISVDESALVDTVGRLTTFEDINAGTDTLIGPQYDFGAVALASGGNLPADAPRLRFVGDPQIFRQYKRYLNNQWEYHLVPAPPRAIPKTSSVAVVSGAYAVTVTDGVTTENYTVTTLYDFLLALGDSALIEVSGAVVKDLSPGGMSTVDLPLKTAAYHLNVEYGRLKALENLIVKAVAPTEIIELTCVDDSLLSAEVWSVKGSTSGTLPQARTSIPYQEGSSPVGFTIPAWRPDLQLSPAAGPAVKLDSISYASRTDLEIEPEILVRHGAVGIAGKAMTLKATYTKFKRTPECNALEATLTGAITAACLGLEPNSINGGAIMALEAAYQTRLIALYEWQKAAMEFDAKLFTVAGSVLHPLDVDLVKQVTQIMADCLALIWSDADGLTAYDAWITDVQTEIDMLQTDDLGVPEMGYALLYDKYRAGANACLASAGIVPGKSEGSAVSTGCWTELEQDYWEIEGYAPAYSNTAYISTKFSSDGAPYSSKEFGFFIACKCTANLKYGDTLTIRITAGATTSKTFQVGDTFKIPVIAATPLQLSGGQDGDDTVTWKVKGMVSGALDDYPVVLDVPDTYVDTASGFSFDLALGGIPFALGDVFSLSIEGGHFKWRKNSGSWSSSLAVADTLLTDGLTAVFSPGASPSLAPGDFFHFLARQPGAPSNVINPDAAGWRFDDNSATLTCTWGAAVTVDTIALARMTGTPSLEYSLNGISGWTALPAMTAGRGVWSLALAEALDIKGLRLTVAKAGGASVGWLWAGKVLTTQYAPQEMKLRRVFDMVRGPKDATALQLGEAWAGEVGWPVMDPADFDEHLAMIEACKSANDAPLIFIPHYLHPAEAIFVKILSDSLDLTDEFQFHPDDATMRLQALTLPFAPVFR